ncbi:MAG: hypothetical protein K0S74_1477 [Chlamydiales bacterium]|jgi:regulatory protein|nr:hypothetical protein [Chlamydiales bacterium]
MEVSYRVKDQLRKIGEILVEGDPWREVDLTLFRRKPSFGEASNTLAELTDEFHRIELGLAKNYALYLLSQRSYSSFKLKQKLEDKKVSETTAEAIITEFRERGYLNDELFAEQLIRSRVRAKQGPKQIALKLRAQGISIKDNEELQELLHSRKEQKKSIQKLLQGTYRRYDLTDYHERQKVTAALLRKGFDSDLVYSTLRHPHTDEE